MTSSFLKNEVPNAGKDANRNLRWCAYAVLLALTTGLLSAAVWRVKPLLSANDRSRWCTVWSLVERHTYEIDEIDAVPGWGTIDKVRSNGHFYSSKPPILSTLVAGVYWGLTAATGWSLDENTEETTRTILLFVNVLPLLIGVVVIIRLVERYARTDFACIFLAGTFALGTFLTTFSVTLNNHTVAALAVLFSIYACSRVVVDGSNCPGHFLLAGFFAGFAAVNELPAAAFAAAAFGLVLWKKPARAIAWFLPAALFWVAVFFVTSYLATGDWKPFYAYYGSDKYKYVLDGVPSYWMHPGGLDANTESPLLYLLNCTIGHHGILSLSPVFVLALAGWCVPRFWKGFPLRIWLAISAAITAVVLAFYLSRTQNYNYGGNTAGLRWIFWLIPLWLVSMIPVLDAWAGRRLLQGFACALLAVTTFSSWYPIDNPWQHPWLFRVMERWGWIDYSHRPEDFTRPVFSFFPLLPARAEAHEWIEFVAPEPDGGSTSLRLRDEGPVAQAGRMLRRISIVWKEAQGVARTQSLVIDPERFRVGSPPAEFLVSDAGPVGGDRAAIEEFLQGMPSPRAYRRGTVRYLKTPLRNDAFECRLAAAQVAREDPQTHQVNRYRIDAWLTAAVPFGVLQFEQTVRDDATDEILSVRRYTAVSSSRSFPSQEPTKGSSPQANSDGLNIPQ